MQRHGMIAAVAVAAAPAIGAGVAPTVAAHVGRPVAGAAQHKHNHNGRIVFQAYVGRSPQVFTIEPDGKGLGRSPTSQRRIRRTIPARRTPSGRRTEQRSPSTLGTPRA